MVFSSTHLLFPRPLKTSVYIKSLAQLNTVEKFQPALILEKQVTTTLFILYKRLWHHLTCYCCQIFLVLSYLRVSWVRCGCLIPGIIQDQVGWDFEQPSLVKFVQGGWNWMRFKVLSDPNHPVIVWWMVLCGAPERIRGCEKSFTPTPCTVCDYFPFSPLDPV